MLLTESQRRGRQAERPSGCVLASAFGDLRRQMERAANLAHVIRPFSMFQSQYPVYESNTDGCYPGKTLTDKHASR